MVISLVKERSALEPAKLQSELEARYPDLRVIEEAGDVSIRGSFPVIYESTVVDRFQIEVKLPGDFPDSFPLTWETGGRLPRTLDRHTFTNGAACLLVEEEWLSLPRQERTITSFFMGPVHNYFLGQCFVELKEPWPHGERAHGLDGLIESFKELLGVEDAGQVVRFLRLLTHKRIKGHWNCPCGSGLIIRRCHLGHIRNLHERITPALAEKALKRLVFYHEQEEKSREKLKSPGE